MSPGPASSLNPAEAWRSAVAAFREDAAARWPQEACGVVGPDGGYVAVPNVSPTPLEAFTMPDDTLPRLRPLAILHSHASQVAEDGSEEPGYAAPSAADMVGQAETGLPWGISLTGRGGATEPFWFGDEVPRPPLIGRVFRHGVTDCYSLIRDWHAEVVGIQIPDFPRDDAWWDAGETLYGRFGEAGFARVERGGAPLPGDVFLCKIRSPVENHGGIYIGDGLILHHLHGQLSMRQPASPWRTKLHFLVRHRDLPETWSPS